MNRPLRCRALPAAAVVALLLAGCGGGTTVVALADAPMPVAPVAAADPKPTPTRTPAPFEVLGGKITVEPTITADPVTLPPRLRSSAPVCPPRPAVPPGTDFEDLESLDLHAAVKEIGERYDPEHIEPTGKYYTTMVACHPGAFFTMYRVPGSADFDGWIENVARKHHVQAHFVDTNYSLDVLLATQDEVSTRRTQLAEAGAPFQQSHPEHEDGGFVEVAVETNVPAARKVLADLGDRVRIVEGTQRQAVRSIGRSTAGRPVEPAPQAEPAPADATPTESSDVLSQVGKLVSPAKP